MTKKTLTKKTTFNASETSGNSDCTIELEYYFLQSTIFDFDDFPSRNSFGIEIVKKVNAQDMEKKSIKDLSCSEEDTKEMLNKIIQTTTMPMELLTVLDDILGV